MFDNEVTKIVKLFRLYKEAIELADHLIVEGNIKGEGRLLYDKKRKELDKFKASIKKK